MVLGGVSSHVAHPCVQANDNEASGRYDLLAQEEVLQWTSRAAYRSWMGDHATKQRWLCQDMPKPQKCLENLERQAVRSCMCGWCGQRLVAHLPRPIYIRLTSLPSMLKFTVLEHTRSKNHTKSVYSNKTKASLRRYEKFSARPFSTMHRK